MKNKNTVLFKITAFLIILVLLLSNISDVNAMSDFTTTESSDYVTSKNLVTGEEKTEIFKHSTTYGKAYGEGKTETYIPEEFRNQVNILPMGPQNPNEINPNSIIGEDNRYPIPNQWRIL